MPARGNIEYTQIALDSRNGTGAWIQMYGGGTVPSAGNMAVFDANLNVIDGGPPGSGGGGGNLVTSVFGRTGAVVGAVGDYSASQVTNAVDATQSYTNPTWIVSLPWSKITGAPLTGVSGFNGRTGSVMPMTGDYTVSMIPGAVADPTTTIGDILVRGISTIARLGVGSNGQVLTADSTQPLGVHWATPTGGGSGSQTPWLSDIQGANYSLWNTNAIEVDGGLLGNAYSSGGWRYRGPNSAFMLQVTGGQGTLFNTAPAGAPGALINFTNALTFADSGNIGVGTVSPNYKLDVAGPVNSNACYYVNGVVFACSDGGSGINLSNINNINGLPPGTGGGGGAGQIEETPVGRMDGTNTSFTLSHAPGPNALSLFLDGVLQQQGVDYTLSGNTITYTVAPNSADWHVAVYGLGGEAFPVMSVFGRTGAVVSNTGDYIAAQVTNAVDQTQTYPNPAWITSLDWSKITNAPGPGTYQTPWLSNINAAGYTLDNASLIRATVYQSSPPATGVGLEMSWQSSYGQIQAFDRSLQQYRPLVIQGSPIVFMQGQIGIGTTGPQYSLDTVGDINITGQYRVNGTPLALGQNQTPWLSNIDAGQYQLNNASQINFTTTSAPVRTGFINCASNGMNISTGTGTALSISAINPITIASNISINSSATAPGGTAFTWVVTGGVTAMAIYANARIAIGLSTAPQYSLDLAGDINITGQYRVNGTPIGAGGSQTPWLQNIDGGGFTLTNVSQIGVGTTAPIASLDVAGAIRSTAFSPMTSGTGVEVGWSSGAGYVQAINRSAGAHQPMHVNAAPLVLNVDSGSNVGIGISTPQALLSLNNAVATVKLAVFDPGAGSGPVYGIGVNPSQLTFGAGIPVNGTPQMVLTAGGNVGIGNTSPQAMLSVNGNIRTTGNTGIPTSGQGTEIQYNVNGGFMYAYDRSANGYLPMFVDGSTLSLNSQSGGHVGINTTAPAVQFQVAKLPGGIAQIDFGDDTYGSGTTLNGMQFLAYNDGSFYIDCRTHSNNNLFFRCGADGSAGYTNTWMSVNTATGQVTIPSLVSNASIPSYFAAMTGGSVILTGSWQNMPGCAFTINQTGRFLVMLNAEIQSNALGPVVTGLLINSGGPYGQQTFHYVSGTCQCSQQFVVSSSAGQVFTLAAYMNVGGGASASVYPACTNITAIYLGP